MGRTGHPTDSHPEHTEHPFVSGTLETSVQLWDALDIRQTPSMQSENIRGLQMLEAGSYTERLSNGQQGPQFLQDQEYFCGTVTAAPGMAPRRPISG